MLNLRKEDRERFISQKCIISTNKFEYVNFIIQFDEIVDDRNEFFSIEKNQDNLNKNDHNDQSENFKQQNIDSIIKD